MTIEGKEVEWDESFRDFASFLHSLANHGGGLSVTCMEVPLDAFVSAQEAGALVNMEIAIDDNGHPFLMAIARASESHQAVLVSVSFAALEPDAVGEEEDGEDEEGGRWLPFAEEEGVMTDVDPRLN